MLRQLIQDIPPSVHITPCPEVVLNVPIPAQFLILLLAGIGILAICVALYDAATGTYY